MDVRMRELDLKMMEMKQAAATVADEPPPCKKARTAAPGPAADMPRHRGKRFNISHIVWADLVEDEDVPDLDTVFRTVHAWFKNREGAPSKCPLDIEVLRADHDVPVVYVLPAECRRGLAERHRDDLRRYVRRTLVPDTLLDTEDDASENCADPGALRPAEPAPCFALARAGPVPPPPELLPPSVAQQAQDLADLARMTRLLLCGQHPGANGHRRGGLAGAALGGARGAPAHRGGGAGLPGAPPGPTAACARPRPRSDERGLRTVPVGAGVE
jgi:hypothetical protein